MLERRAKSLNLAVIFFKMIVKRDSLIEISIGRTEYDRAFIVDHLLKFFDFEIYNARRTQTKLRFLVFNTCYFILKIQTLFVY